MIEIKEKWKREIGYTIRDVDISANGEYIIVGSFDYNVYLFDRNGTLLWQYKTGNTVRDVAISFDGKYMAAGSYDKFVYFFNTRGDLLWKFEAGNSLRDISIAAGGEYLVVGSNDKKVYFFDRKGNLLWDHKTGAAVFTVAMSTNGEYVAIGSYDRKVHFFNKKGNKLWEWETGSAIRDVEMTTKGKYVAAGSYDRHLYFLDRNGKLLWKRKHGSSVEKVAISPTGDQIAAGGQGEISLYDRKGNLLWKHNTGIYEIRGLEISTLGGSIICGSRDNELLYYEKDGRLLWKFQTPQWVESVAVGAKGRFITAGLRNGVLYQFDSLEFFKDYLEQARQAIVRLENFGTDAGKVNTIYASAEVELENENYMKALAQAIRARTIAEKGVREKKPKISYIVRHSVPFEFEKWNPITFKIGNSGNADSQDIFIRIHGNIRVRGVRKIEILPSNSFKVLRLDIRPLASGEQKLDLQISYFDYGGREYVDTDVALIHVSDNSSPLPPGHSGPDVLFKNMPDSGTTDPGILRTTPKCPNCNRDIWSEWIVCPFCATPLK